MRYWRIITSLGWISMMTALEYRANLFITGIFKFIESAAGFGIIFLIVSLSSGIGEWSKSEVLIISLSFTLTTSIVALFLWPGMKQFSRDLNIGNIDNYLIKPINLQFYVSIFAWDWTQIFRLVGSAIAIVLVSKQANLNAPIFSYFIFAILLLISVILYYLFGFFIISSILFLKRVRNIDYLANILWEPGKWPTSIFPGFLRIAFAVAIPLWFAATVPVGVLVGKYSFAIVLLELAITGTSYWVTSEFLSSGLRRYSSASS